MKRFGGESRGELRREPREVVNSLGGSMTRGPMRVRHEFKALTERLGKQQPCCRANRSQICVERFRSFVPFVAQLSSPYNSPGALGYSRSQNGLRRSSDIKPIIHVVPRRCPQGYRRTRV